MNKIFKYILLYIVVCIVVMAFWQVYEKINYGYLSLDPFAGFAAIFFSTSFVFNVYLYREMLS